MPEKSWTIGSDPSCELVVNSNTVSGRHCRLTRDGSEFTLTDLDSTNGTYVNGERLLGSRAVKMTDSITLGQSQQMPWPDGVKRPSVSKSLGNKPANKRKDKPTKTISIGRGPDNDVILRDSNVSTSHARLIIGGNEITLEDLGSTNGTSIGSVENKISRSAVHRSDTIFFGSTSYRVSDLLDQSQPSHVAPRVQPKLDSGSKSSNSGRPTTMVVSAVIAVLLLTGGIWFATRQPKAVDAVRVDKPSPAPKTLEPSVTSAQVESTGEERDGISPVADSVSIALSPQEKLARSVFLIVCADVQRETPFRVGSGFAIDSGTIVTSASVIRAVQNLRQNGFPDVFLFSPADNSELQIASTALHPQFETAETAARKAQQTHDSIFDQLELEPPKPETFESVKDRLISARMDALEAMNRKATYDVAVIKTTESLEHWLPAVSAATKLRPKQKVNVTGYAYDTEDPFFERDAPFELSTMSSRIAQFVTEATSSADRLVADGGLEQHEYAYLGSPVLTTQGQVVGVYSRPTPPVVESGDALLRSFDVALFIRVHECREAQQSL